MTLSDAEISLLQNIERQADDLLARIATAPEIISPQTLKKLDFYACAAAKIAFGSNRPHLLSDQMMTLIAWTDHLDDSLLVERFQQALMTRPLASPW